MRQMPAWGKILVILGLCVAVLLPLLLFALNNPRVATLLPAVQPASTDSLSKRYSTESKLSGYSLRLIDTKFLDYVLSDMNLFGARAIIDPRFYQGYTDVRPQPTVSQIQFVLVGAVDHPVGIVVHGDGQTTPVVVVGQGNYKVEGDTLVVEVVLNFDELTGQPLTQKFSLEDTFLQTALNTLYYAQGSSKPGVDNEALGRIKQNIQDYLYAGIFTWPFRIDRI